MVGLAQRSLIGRRSSSNENLSDGFVTPAPPLVQHAHIYSAVIPAKSIWQDVEGNPIARGQTLDAASRQLSAAHENAGAIGVDPHNAMPAAIKVIGNDGASLHWLTRGRGRFRYACALNVL